MKLIIADDSAVVRAILDQKLTKISGMEIIASVSNGRRAIDAAKGERPDAVISDINMPEMDGLEATKILSKSMHIPVILMSEDASKGIAAKTAGAVEFMVKPKVNEYGKSFFDELEERLSAIVSASPQPAHAERGSRNRPFRGYRVLCIGASTGGPTAVEEVLKGLGRNFPLPILYAQHVEIGADRNLADWLNSNCDNLTVRLARDGEEALPGTVYMAPADRHLLVDFVKGNSHPVLRISDDPPERFLRPAVNMLFRSAARLYGKACLAVLLTGMGRDGAEGCKLIRDSGGWTLVEDRSTCAVFGMPAAAIEVGGACEVYPRGEIAGRILELARSKGLQELDI